MLNLKNKIGMAELNRTVRREGRKEGGREERNERQNKGRRPGREKSSEGQKDGMREGEKEPRTVGRWELIRNLVFPLRFMAQARDGVKE